MLRVSGCQLLLHSDLCTFYLLAFSLGRLLSLRTLLTFAHSRYGRKLSSGGKKKVLERLYVPEDEEDADIEVEDDDVVEKELSKLDAAGSGKLMTMARL